VGRNLELEVIKVFPILAITQNEFGIKNDFYNECLRVAIE
jgi:hypothetical protein